MTRKRKLDPAVIRVGDTIRVITPEFFIRCGYPKTLQSETELVTKEHDQRIKDFLIQVGVVPVFNGFDYTGCEDEVNRIAKAIAYMRLGTKGLGGKERKLYTDVKPEYKDKTFQVRYKKVVKTGVYHKGSWCGYEEPEYQPAYLENEKTHMILTLFGSNCPSFVDLEIEQKNVIKVTE